MSKHQSEVSFVRGIAWHDIAKPFYLGREKHSRTGFMLLVAAGHREEATAALCHVAGNHLRENLRQYHQLSDRARLPAVLLLSNALDRLAASSYSFMEDFDLERLSPRPLNAWHNPFTHLPEFHSTLNKRFQVEDAQRSQEVDGKLRYAVANSDSTPTAWRDYLDELLQFGGDTGAALVWPEELEPATGEDGQLVDPVALFYEYSRAYPERTYPPVNDTVLSEHTRLSAVFAWVVYRNLAAAPHPFLEWAITPAPDGGQLPDGSDAVDFVSPRREFGLGYAPGQALVRDHLRGYLVRITFNGHRQWVEEAARLDDLNGAQVLTARMRTAFKRELAAQLEVEELAEFLSVSESAFDLVYLLPEALGDENDLKALIHDSYQAALDWLVDGQDNPDSLRELLDDDFRRADPPLGITAPTQMADLKKQLLSLGYNTHIERIQPPTDEEDYGAFSAAYGEMLLKAYRNSHQQKRASLTALRSAIAVLAESEATASEDVCTICGTHPVYRPLADRMADDEFLKKVTHTFRDEPERLCLACIARRALAHKQVQVEALHHMLAYDPATGQIRAGPADELKLGLPPALLHTGELEGRDDFVDMGAAFVRLARRREAKHSLDIFPTVSYAADSMGNVAMLTLSATDAVFEAYDYRPARRRVEQASDAERASPAWDAFIKDYDTFCRQIADTQAELLEQVEVVKPHLARALARQARISRFFEAVTDRLEDAGIRALALDTTYPTGRWLVSAMELPGALETLGKTVAADLLAAPDGVLDELTRRLLVLIAPSLLDGTVVVFKQKFPIYLVMEAERALRAELATGQPFSGGGWYGIHLALADMRGTLTSRVAGRAVVTLDALPDLLELSRKVDRRSVTGRVADLGRDKPGAKWAQEVANARIYVRSGWWRLGEQGRLGAARALIREDTFRSVLFLKRMARE